MVSWSITQHYLLSKFGANDSNFTRSNNLNIQLFKLFMLQIIYYVILAQAKNLYYPLGPLQNISIYFS